MNLLFTSITEQYRAVVESRTVLLEYCKTVSAADFLNENSSFGRGGSIRNLLVHIANVYEYWIAHHALKKDIAYTAYDANNSMDDILHLFDRVNKYMQEFIEMFLADPEQYIQYTLNNESRSTSLLWLFTHVITHEFHHKGQILSLSRHLGYIPVDTDVIR